MEGSPLEEADSSPLSSPHIFCYWAFHCTSGPVATQLCSEEGKAESRWVQSDALFPPPTTSPT